jgi:hypothetical protein
LKKNNTKIYARNCEITTISSDEKSNFLMSSLNKANRNYDHHQAVCISIAFFLTFIFNNNIYALINWKIAPLLIIILFLYIYIYIFNNCLLMVSGWLRKNKEWFKTYNKRDSKHFRLDFFWIFIFVLLNNYFIVKLQSI